MSDEVTIKVKTIDSREHSVKIQTRWSVAQLKAHLSSLLSIPIDRMRLIVSGRVMKDEQPLSTFSLTEGHTVHLVQRPVQPEGPEGVPRNEGVSAGFPSTPSPGGPPPIPVVQQIVMGSFPIPNVAAATGGDPQGQQVPLRTTTINVQQPSVAGPPITGLTLHVHCNLAELDGLPERLRNLSQQVNFQIPNPSGLPQQQESQVRVEAVLPGGGVAGANLQQQLQQTIGPMLQGIVQTVQNVAGGIGRATTSTTTTTTTNGTTVQQTTVQSNSSVPQPQQQPQAPPTSVGGIPIPQSLQGLVSNIMNATQSPTDPLPSLHHMIRTSGLDSELDPENPMDSLMDECIRHMDIHDIMRVFATGDWSAVNRIQPILVNHMMRISQNRTMEGRRKVVESLVNGAMKELDGDPGLQQEYTGKVRTGCDARLELARVMTASAERIVNFVFETSEGDPLFGQNLRGQLVRCFGMASEYLSQRVLLGGYGDYFNLQQRVFTAMARKTLQRKPELGAMWGMVSNLLNGFTQAWLSEYQGTGYSSQDMVSVERAQVPQAVLVPPPAPRVATDDVDSLLDDVLLSVHQRPSNPQQPNTSIATTTTSAATTTTSTEDLVRRDAESLRQAPAFPPLSQGYLDS